MTKNISIKDAIVMIGHADPDTKIKGWLTIGENVSIARNKFGTGAGKRNNEGAAAYREWLNKSGIIPGVSVASANRAAVLFDKRRSLSALRRADKIPKTWTSPELLLRGLTYIDKGLDPAAEETRKRGTNHSVKDTTKDGDIKLWSDGLPGAFYSEGLAFGNMLNRLPRMTKADQMKAVGAFFGTSTHTIKAERLADGSIRVFEKVNKDAPVERAKFDIKISFHNGASK